MKYDNLLKTIFYDAMPSLLRALGCAPVVEYLSVEFPTQDKQVADVVALLEDGKILHLEFQETNDARMLWRCYHYYGAIQERWEQADVIQVVVYFGNGPVRMRHEIDKGRNKYGYDIVDMRSIPAEVFLKSPSDAERVLALLCESADPRETIRRVLGSWRHLPEKELRGNIDRLKTLCQLRGREIMGREEVEQMPFESGLDIKDSLFFKEAYPIAYKEAFPEAYKVAYREAYEEASKAAGAPAAARLLTKQLEHRFGPLPERERQFLASASIEQLETWAIRATDVHRLEDVFAN